MITIYDLATIKERRQQVVLPTPPYVLPPLTKFESREQHSQNNQHMNHVRVELEAKSKTAIHFQYLQRPPKRNLRGLIALSATCTQGESNSTPLIDANQHHSLEITVSRIQEAM